MRGDPLAARVYALLADGVFRSGEELAAALGVSRGAIWKAAVSLRELGVVLDAVRNRGYRLVVPTDVLTTQAISDSLPEETRQRIRQLDVVWSIASTNAALMERADLPQGMSDVMLAEYQTAGRGRRGRAWFAPPGGAICLSMSWGFPEVPRDIGALSLAIGVCVMRALHAGGLENIRLKWPNDLQHEARKLCGILIEMRAESAGPAYVVIGIGLNVALGPDLLGQIAATGTSATDLKSAGMQDLRRNAIAARIIDACVHGLMKFERDGLKPFIEQWRSADALRGREVAVHIGEQTVRGTARGIDMSGALLVETPEGLRKFISGEVTVRSAT